MKKRKYKVILIVIALVSMSLGLVGNGSSVALAATNLVKGGDFENAIDDDWDLWYEGIGSEGAARKFEMYRSYDSAFGNGSYSVAIEAVGEPGTLFSASISSAVKNSFAVEANKKYYLIYNVKAKQATEEVAYLIESGVYSPVTEVKTEVITTEWQKKFIVLSPTKAAKVQLALSFGNMADGNVINIDGVQIVEAQNGILTTDVKGKIGDKDKYFKLSDAAFLDKNNIEVELPYYDPLTKLTAEKRFASTKISGANVYFDFAKGTYSGIAKVYISGSLVGNFNYNVLLNVDEVSPSLVRADEDLVIYGSGFNPRQGNTFIVVKQKNKEGVSSEKWIEPVNIDSALTQISAKLPLGVVSGDLYIYTSYYSNKNADVINLSNKFKYQVKPVIYDIRWGKRGYEQVGDTLVIYSKGAIDNPLVNFYNENGNKIDGIKAKISEIGEREIITVPATKKASKFFITVVSGGVESSKVDALSYSARPKLLSILTKNNRTAVGSSEKISAAKVGEIIKIKSEGLLNISTSTTHIEFKTYGGNINVPITRAQVDTSGTVTVVVPQGAQNGYVSVVVNGEKSNSLPLEIIPTIIEVAPSVIIPGREVFVTVDGIGMNTELTKLYFNLGNGREEIVAVEKNEIVNNLIIIKATVPLTIPSKSSSIRVQYDNWMNDSSVALKINPQINRVRMDIDTKVLTIEGYGFSIIPKDNKITYKYADEAKTVVAPSAKILGVYSTENGQEIRIQINDDYHYGYVSVEVGGLASNESNFGPLAIKRIARRVEYVKSLDRVMGVLYISGNNFGEGDVRVGDIWAETHYRSNFMIIAVVEKENVNRDPVLITKK